MFSRHENFYSLLYRILFHFNPHLSSQDDYRSGKFSACKFNISDCLVAVAEQLLSFFSLLYELCKELNAACFCLNREKNLLWNTTVKIVHTVQQAECKWNNKLLPLWTLLKVLAVSSEAWAKLFKRTNKQINETRPREGSKVSRMLKICRVSWLLDL